MDDGSTPGVDLVEAIEQVRSELARAVEASRGQAIRFRTGPVELEFEVSYQRAIGAEAGIRVWVVSAGAKGEVRRTAGHRVKLTLFPVDAGNNDLLIADVDLAADAAPAARADGTQSATAEDVDVARG